MYDPQGCADPKGHALRRLIRCCAILILVAASAGCGAGQPAPAGTLPAVTIAGERLRSGRQPFEVRGVNYIHPSNADLSVCSSLQFGADGNCPWDITPIAADFDTLRGLGVNTVRVFLDYYVFGGARAADPNVPPSMLRLLFAEDAQTIVQNLARNLLENRVTPTEVICAKP